MSNRFIEWLKGNSNNEKHPSLEDGIKMIEKALKDIDIPPSESRLETENKNTPAWGFSYENIDIYIYLIKDKNTLYFKIKSPILKMPEDNILAFYRVLLEKNLNLHELTLGIYKDTVFLYGSRPIEDMTVKETIYMIMEVAKKGEEIAEELHKEFNAEYGNEEG